MTQFTHRIRRCEGNKEAWCLIALLSEGSEDLYYMTAMSIDDLLRRSKGLLPTPEDHVQIIYYSPEE